MVWSFSLLFLFFLLFLLSLPLFSFTFYYIPLPMTGVEEIMCDLTCTWTKRLVTWLVFGPNDLWLDLTWRLTKWLVTWLGLARKWFVTWLGLAKNDLLPSLYTMYRYSGGSSFFWGGGGGCGGFISTPSWLKNLKFSECCEPTLQNRGSAPPL